MSRHGEDLMRFFDGELDDAEARRVEQDLAKDPDDRQRLAALSELRTLLRDAAQRDAATAPSEAMWIAIRDQLATGRRPSLGERLAVAWRDLFEGPARYWMPATVGAAALAMAFVALRPGAREAVARDVVIESVETAGVTATVFQIPDEAGGDGIAVLWITPESEGDEE